uniref:Uncharacterized protein n=1 Tax=Triticum urartu TaxID=4572 RepID=A0A8R7PQD3_TRIUA
PPVFVPTPSHTHALLSLSLSLSLLGSSSYSPSASRGRNPSPPAKSHPTATATTSWDLIWTSGLPPPGPCRWSCARGCSILCPPQLPIGAKFPHRLERPEPSVASVEVSAYRTRHSPSWSFRWDNRTHIEDIMENAALFSNHSSGNIRPELKSGSIAPTEGHPNEDNLPDVFRGVKCQKPDKKMEASKRSKAGLQG